MTDDTRSILDDLLLTPVASRPGRFTLDVDDGWRVLHVFGGMTKAIALAAARRSLDRDDLSLVSAQSTYVSPVGAGPISVDADVVRSGRRGAQVSVRLRSGSDPAPALLVDAVFGRPDEGFAEVGRSPFPPDAGRPETSSARDESGRGPAFAIPFHRQTDWRLAVGSMDPDAPPSDARSVSWFRFRRSPIPPGAGAWDPVALAVPGDILGPAVTRGLGGAWRHFVITLQLSLQWFAPVRTEWVCQHATVVRGAGGFVTGVAELWSEDAELVGFATQVAMLRPFDRVAADGLQGDESQG